MRITKKIRFKFFIPLSLGVVAGSLFFLDDGQEMAGLLLIYLSTLLWLASMVFMVASLLPNANKGGKVRPDYLKLILLLLFKLILFGIILSIGWQLMGKKLFIALLSLPLQTIILGLSFSSGPKDFD